MHTQQSEKFAYNGPFCRIRQLGFLISAYINKQREFSKHLTALAVSGEFSFGGVNPTIGCASGRNMSANTHCDASPTRATGSKCSECETYLLHGHARLFNFITNYAKTIAYRRKYKVKGNCKCPAESYGGQTDSI